MIIIPALRLKDTDHSQNQVQGQPDVDGKSWPLFETFVLLCIHVICMHLFSPTFEAGSQLCDNSAGLELGTVLLWYSWVMGLDYR